MQADTENFSGGSQSSQPQVVEEESLKFMCAQMDLVGGNLAVETVEDIEKRFKKWNFVLNSVTERVHSK